MSKKPRPVNADLELLEAAKPYREASTAKGSRVLDGGTPADALGDGALSWEESLESEMGFLAKEEKYFSGRDLTASRHSKKQKKHELVQKTRGTPSKSEPRRLPEEHVADQPKPPSKSELRRLREEHVADALLEEAGQLFERQRISRNRTITTTAVRDTLFREDLEASLSAIFRNKIVAKPYSPKKSKPTERALNLLLSDLHFGANLDPREVPLRFGPQEEARRIAAVTAQAAEYKPQYRAETVLNVHLAGDIIEGELHDPRNVKPLAEQCAAAIHYLTQSIAYLSTQFKTVNVFTTPGNHDRNTARHRERAIHQKWDGIGNIIYFAIKTALASLPNVNFVIQYAPYYLFDSFGRKGMVTHGDTVANVGYPGKTISIDTVTKVVNAHNGPVSEHERIGLLAIGHVHIGSCVRLPNRAVFISNGALVPPGPHSLSLNSFDAACGQMLWESVPGHIVGDHRFLVVDEYTDKDADLEKIVRPFRGF